MPQRGYRLGGSQVSRKFKSPALVSSSAESAGMYAPVACYGGEPSVEGCGDEKTAIQALDRLVLVLPLSPR